MMRRWEIELAREHLADIARDRAKYLKPEGQEKALAWVALVLEKWKLQQAAPDGTINVAPEARLLSLGLPAIRLVASEMRPEECAGPDVGCAYELFMRLADEEYPDVIQIISKIPFDIIGALLIKRDYKSMPLDVMAMAARAWWVVADEMARDHRTALGKKKAAEAEKAALRVAQMNAQKRKNTLFRGDTIERLGVEFFQKRENRRATNHACANYIYEQTRGDKEFKIMTVSGIAEKLSGTKQRALALLPEKSK